MKKSALAPRVIARMQRASALSSFGKIQACFWNNTSINVQFARYSRSIAITFHEILRCPGVAFSISIPLAIYIRLNLLLIVDHYGSVVPPRGRVRGATAASVAGEHECNQKEENPIHKKEKSDLNAIAEDSAAAKCVILVMTNPRGKVFGRYDLLSSGRGILTELLKLISQVIRVTTPRAIRATGTPTPRS